MKNVNTIGLAVLVAIGVAGCNGLSKMSKNAPTVKYEVTPNPLEMHGDSVALNITAKYPAKYFAKKATLTVTPAIKSSTDSHEYKNFVAIGEKAEGAGSKITYSTGGTVTYSDKIMYKSDMRWSEVELRIMGAQGKKSLAFPAMKIADATITTPLLVRNEDKAIIGKDNFQKVISMPHNASVYYPINQSGVSSGYKNTKIGLNNSDEMKSINEFVKKAKDEQITMKSVTVKGYASPDGAYELNDKLSQARANTSTKYLMGEMKKAKVEGAANDEFYQKSAIAEDWDGFKALMEASDIADKEMILRVLQMQTDADAREREIKAMSMTYTQLADKILPKLRRSQVTINAEKQSRTDAQIDSVYSADKSVLSVEEVLYLATLSTDNSRKLAVYTSASQQYAGDWRTFNNMGVVNVDMGNYSEAKKNFEKADELSANNPIVQNNLGVTARRMGDIKTAEKHFANAEGAGEEVKSNRAIVSILKGNYSAAVAYYGSNNTYNASLAKLLSGDKEGAMKTLDASPAAGTAHGSYLKSVIAARMDNKELTLTSLSTAVARDASLKDMAKTDMEFLKYMGSADFKAVVQ